MLECVARCQAAACAVVFFCFSNRQETIVEFLTSNTQIEEWKPINIILFLCHSCFNSKDENNLLIVFLEQLTSNVTGPIWSKIAADFSTKKQTGVWALSPPLHKWCNDIQQFKAKML